MIKLERTSVMNIDNAIRGMRNAKNSWEKSDSYWTHIEKPETMNEAPFQYFVGANDLKLARTLASAGSDHRKFLRQIFVSVDITAPLYWWKEYDTYKVGTVANSCSTMHTIHKKEFTIDDFSHERMLADGIVALRSVIDQLNRDREAYLETKDMDYWNDMIQLLPSSYNQMRTCTLNYENLANIRHARSGHKLAEWHVLCDWIDTLPYFTEIFMK